MASLNRAAWLPSKVTKLRSGKMEHRPAGGQGTKRINRCLQGQGCVGTRSRCLGLFLGDAEALGARGSHRGCKGRKCARSRVTLRQEVPREVIFRAGLL